jgi:hypothetical protein
VLDGGQLLDAVAVLLVLLLDVGDDVVDRHLVGATELEATPECGEALAGREVEEALRVVAEGADVLQGCLLGIDEGDSDVVGRLLRQQVVRGDHVLDDLTCTTGHQTVRDEAGVHDGAVELLDEGGACRFLALLLESLEEAGRSRGTGLAGATLVASAVGRLRTGLGQAVVRTKRLGLGVLGRHDVLLECRWYESGLDEIWIIH